MIYLDYSANTPVDEAVLQRFCEVERNCPGNANSRHAAGTAAKAAIDAATQSIARSLNVQPAEIIYTSGASEANNFAIKSIARLERHHGRHIISTPLEHSSVSGSLTALQEQGYEIDLVDIRQDGTVDLAHLKELLRPDTILVAVTAVDSELGVVQPVAEIAEMLKACPHCHFHVDATQAVGKLPVSFAGIDTMSLTAHKFYGLNGIGVLVKRRGLALEPLIHGGESTTLPQRHPHRGAGLFAGAGTGKGSERAARPGGAHPRPERPPAHRACPIPQGAHQQPGHRRAADFKPERTEREGHRVPAGAGCQGRMRLGQIGLLFGRPALPRRVCREP